MLAEVRKSHERKLRTIIAKADNLITAVSPERRSFVAATDTSQRGPVVRQLMAAADQLRVALATLEALPSPGSPGLEG
jgi:hypothetical protein